MQCLIMQVLLWVPALQANVCSKNWCNFHRKETFISALWCNLHLFHRDCWRQNQETGHKERFHLGGNDWEKAKRFSEADLQCQGSFKLESETGIGWVSWKFASGMYKVKKHITCLINVRLFVVKQIIFCSSLKDAF